MLRRPGGLNYFIKLVQKLSNELQANAVCCIFEGQITSINKNQTSNKKLKNFKIGCMERVALFFRVSYKTVVQQCDNPNH